MLCFSTKEKKNDFPLSISNIHMCTISLIIYNKQFCNKFLPPLHFLYIVDDIKDRCDPRSFIVVIFGRQEKKKKKWETRFILCSAIFSLSRMNIGVTVCTISARMSTPRAISFIFTITFVGNKHNRFRNRIKRKTGGFVLKRYAAKFSEEELNRFENKKRGTKREKK